MTGYSASRAHAAASSEVVVIRSINGPYAFRNGVLPKALICQGSWGEFEPGISIWQRLFTGSLAVDMLPTAARISQHAPIGSGPSVFADVPGRPPPRGDDQHEDTNGEHRKSHEFKHQRVHCNPPDKPIDL